MSYNKTYSCCSSIEDIQNSDSLSGTKTGTGKEEYFKATIVEITVPNNKIQLIIFFILFFPSANSTNPHEILYHNFLFAYKECLKEKARQAICIF